MTPAPAPWTLHGSGLIALYSPSACAPAGGGLMLVRYARSPVGPYDEVLWLEPVRTRRGWRPQVRQIVVSSAASVAGGRHNWAIPKTLAHFAWTANSVRVTHPGGAPCLSLSFSGVQGPSLPVSAGLLPPAARTLWQRDEAGGEKLTTVSGRVRVRPAGVRVEAAPGWSPVLSTQKPLVVLGVPDFVLTFPPARVA